MFESLKQKEESNWSLVKTYHGEVAGHQRGQDPASGHPHPTQMSQGYSKHPGKGRKTIMQGSK